VWLLGGATIGGLGRFYTKLLKKNIFLKWSKKKDERGRGG
jgi:hypothetical protein